VSDSHLHVNPIRGLGGSVVARQMKEAGLWFAAILSLPHWDYGIDLSSLEDYKRVFQLHSRECEEARRAGLTVSCFSGLHPAEIDRLIDRGMPPAEALELSLKIIDFLFRACEEGLIQGVGEIGRQHYSVRPDKALIAEEVFRYALQKARDHDCVVQLHLENLKGFTGWSVERAVKATGVRKELLILHHVKPGLLEELHARGFATTTPAQLESLRVAFARADAGLLLIESDYTDDPKSRGRVIYPWALPDIERELLLEGSVSLETLYKVNVDNVEKTFRVVF